MTIAVIEGHTDVVVLLLNAGANIHHNHNVQCSSVLRLNCHLFEFLSIILNFLQAALTEAVKGNHAGIVKLLLNAGADMNVKTEANVVVPLLDSICVYCVLFNFHFSFLCLFVVVQYGNTALIYAARNGYVELVECLLQAGANINDINTVSALWIFQPI